MENKQLPGMITGLVALLAVAAFMIMGFLIKGAWTTAWIVFLVIPLTGIITNLIFNKKNRADTVIGAVAILCVIIFFLLGFLANAWSISWIVFLLIPITAIIVNMFKVIRKDKDTAKQNDVESK